jgi:hypothetical protein
LNKKTADTSMMRDCVAEQKRIEWQTWRNMMNAALKRWFGRTGLMCGLMLVSVQCSGLPPVERRIQKNPQVFAQLSAEDQQLVRSGQLREGMGENAVFLLLGRPDRVTAGRNRGKDYTRWTYVGQRAVTTQTFGMGFGGWGGGWGRGWGGGWCGPFNDPFFMGGPMVTYIPYDAAYVDFAGGRAIGWEVSPRR